LLTKQRPEHCAQRLNRGFPSHFSASVSQV
jgi:hypothetical protein